MNDEQPDFHWLTVGVGRPFVHNAVDVPCQCSEEWSCDSMVRIYHG